MQQQTLINNIVIKPNNTSSFSFLHLSSLFKKHFANLTNDISPLQNPKLNETLSKLNSVFQLLVNSFNDIAVKTYEPIIKQLENRNRSLIRSCLQFNLQKEAYENKFMLLIRKEKEYNLLKESTGAFVENGKVICANHKENEIIILRAENSNLKTQINKVETQLKAFQQREFELKQEFLKEKNKLKHQIDLLNQQIKLTLSHRTIHSHSNININLNDVSHSNLVSTHNNSKSKRNANKVFKNTIADNTDDVNSTEGYTVKYQINPSIQTTTTNALPKDKCTKTSGKNGNGTAGHKKKSYQLKEWFKRKNLFLSPFKTLTQSISPTCATNTNNTNSCNKKTKRKNSYKRKNKKVFMNTQNNILNHLLTNSRSYKGSFVNNSNSVTSARDNNGNTTVNCIRKEKVVLKGQKGFCQTQRTRSYKSLTQRTIYKK